MTAGGRELSAAALAVAVVAAVAFMLRTGGLVVWDDYNQMVLSHWALWQYGIGDGAVEIPISLKFYGTTGELLFGIVAVKLAGFLQDPLWVRHLLTLLALPVSLFVAGRQLVKAGVRGSSVFLFVALVFCLIRFCGHAPFNVKDIPLSCLFLLVTLGLWNLVEGAFRGDPDRGAPPRVSVGWVVRVVLLALVPYLWRPPFALHLVLAALFLAVVVAADRRVAARVRLAAVALPPILVVALVFALTPVFWHLPVTEWLGGVARFARYRVLDVRLFGTTYPSDALPWWYSLVWIPVVMHPLALVLIPAGAWGAVRRGAATAPLALGCGGRTVSVTLLGWVGLVLFLSWFLVLVGQPFLYDEDRHLLFLFPLLMLWVCLGLDWLPAKAKVSLGVVLCLAASLEYVRWGRFAYVYKSPVVGDVSAERFSGDYWGVCVTEAFDIARRRLPQGAQVFVDGPWEIVAIQLNRFARSRIVGDPGVRGWSHPNPDRLALEKPIVVVAINRLDGFRRLDELYRENPDSSEIARVSMPPGSPACRVGFFPRGVRSEGP